MTATETRRTARLLAPVLVAGLLGLGPALAQEDFSPDAKPSRDPFVVLIEKPKPKRRPTKPTAFRPPPPTRKRIPPLVIKISALISSGDETMAVIEYKGADYVVGKGWDGTDEDGFDKRFKVVDVEDDKVIVFDKEAKQRRTIREGGGPGAGGGELSISAGG